ncbi:hypothetical protein FB45DRAFT_936558 [Roridomyces roridus]|uniref:MYND-type domain-containing protein n=1 Tax=Roridomyces roridus TaxID=1738132 RepID=A0AAD7BA66_9AGAR|nr:hypothetical protein FB45DRAFT_936558 [Roridomyces roridus]
MSSIARLPDSIQGIASRAAAPSRTRDDVSLARRFSNARRLSASQRLGLLPVFFANLDVEKIPTSQQLEDLGHSPTILEDISCAVISLDAVFHLDATGDVGTSLWPRVWGWFEFLEMHRDHLPGISLDPETSSYFDFMCFIGCFRSHPATYDLLSTTPHFWTHIVKAWSLLPQMDDAGQRTMMLSTLGEFLSTSNARPDSELLAEMVEAAGSMNDLAGLVLNFVRTTITKPLFDPAYPVVYLNNILVFVVRAGACPDNEFDLIISPRRRLTTALYGLDFEKELVSAILFLCDRSDVHTLTVIGTCIMLLRHCVVVWTPANMWLDVWLQQGLFRALISITHRAGIGYEAEGKLRERLRPFMREISAGLVYYFPTVAFKKAFKEARGLISEDTFKDHPLSAEWKHFLASGRDLLDALDEFNSPTFRTSKACDNLQCGSIDEATAMAGRCSGCHAFYYCSRECQKTDWKAGHRNFCASHKSLILAERDEPNLFFKERSFIRSLLHHKYLKERRAICFKQIQVLAAQPADLETPPLLFTLFDFCELPPAIQVHAAGDLPKHIAGLVGTDSAEWIDIVERAERDGGYTQLHGLCMTDGEGPRVWVIPLRTDIPLIYEGLRTLAERVRLGELTNEGEIMREIDGVLDVEVTEIH